MSKNTPFALQVQKEICTSCGVCAEACTYNAINFSDFPEIDPYACRLCGNCVHIPADTRSAFPVISVQSPVSIQCCWQS